MMSPRPLSGLSSAYHATGREPRGADAPPQSALNRLPLRHTLNITFNEELKTTYIPTPVKLATQVKARVGVVINGINAITKLNISR
jgi:hypothetical protein